MRFKLCCVFLVLITLCGCAGSKVVKPVINNIDFTAYVECDNADYVFDVSISDESTDINLISPEEIAGLNLSFSDSKVLAEYLGIKYTPDSGNMPDGGVAAILNNVINYINQEDVTAVSNENNCSVEGKIGDDKFIFQFSPAGLPLKLEIPNKNYTVKFNDVTIK